VLARVRPVSLKSMRVANATKRAFGAALVCVALRRATKAERFAMGVIAGERRQA